MIASRSPGSDSVAVSPVRSISSSRIGRASGWRSRRERTRSASVTSASPSRYGPWPLRCTMPAASSVASSREAVLALTPIRRANSLTPRPWSLSRSSSSNASARDTDVTGRGPRRVVRAAAPRRRLECAALVASSATVLRRPRTRSEAAAHDSEGRPGPSLTRAAARASEQSDRPSVLVDVDVERRRRLAQARHLLDVTAERDQPAGAGVRAQVADRKREVVGRSEQRGIRGE